MKVRGSGPAKPLSKAKKSSATSEADASFGDAMAAQESSPSVATTTTQSIARVDTLLAVQASEDPTERAARGRARLRSNTILDELDKLRMAMLGGNLTIGHMVDIADVIASHREKIQDPALTAIMDEIDLRAQVELAKMKMAMEAEKGAI